MDRNLFRQGREAFDWSYGQAQAMADQRARKRSGGRLAGGDRMGAAAELAQAGMLEDARLLQNDEAASQRQARLDRQTEEQRAQEMAAKQGEAMIDVLTNLRDAVPEAERMAVLPKIAPLLDKIGVGSDWLSEVTPDQLTDQALTALVGEVESKVKYFNTASGVVAVNQDTGTADLIYQDPLSADYKRAQIDATRARAGASSASAEAARARAAATRGKASAGGGPDPNALATLQALRAELARRRGGQ